MEWASKRALADSPVRRTLSQRPLGMTLWQVGAVDAHYRYDCIRSALSSGPLAASWRPWTLTDEEIARHFPHRDLVPPFRDKAVRYDGRFAGGDVIQLAVGFRKTRRASEEIHHLIPGVGDGAPPVGRRSPHTDGHLAVRRAVERVFSGGWRSLREKQFARRRRRRRHGDCCVDANDAGGRGLRIDRLDGVVFAEIHQGGNGLNPAMLEPVRNHHTFAALD